jgi:hypothetical protein
MSGPLHRFAAAGTALLLATTVLPLSSCSGDGFSACATGASGAGHGDGSGNSGGHGGSGNAGAAGTADARRTVPSKGDVLARDHRSEARLLA